MNKKSSIYCISLVMFLSMVTKIISMASRIIMSRELGVEAVSLYSLVNPIFVFLITISTFSLPTTIATLVSKNPLKGKKIFITSLIIGTILNIFFIIIISFFSQYIAELLLHNYKTEPSIKLLALVVPLTTLSSIIKGYFMGKKELILTSESSLIEECSRLLSVILLIGFFKNFNDEIKSTFFILVMIIGEIIQTSYLILSSGKKYIKNIYKLKDIFSSEDYIFNEVISLSLPLTLSRVVTSFSFMMEPIILTTLLFKQGYSSEEITLNYGILSSYVMPLLLFPGFFSLAVSNYLLPNLSSLIAKNKYSEGQKLFYKILIFTGILGLFFTLIFMFFGDKIIQIIYHVNYGNKEIKLLAFPFIIYYIETPINTAMHALNQSKIAFKSSLISSCVRVILLITLSKFFSYLSVAFSTLGACYLDVLINYLTINKLFKRNNK